MDDRNRKALEISEGFADGRATEPELEAARGEVEATAEEQTWGTAKRDSEMPAYGMAPSGWKARALAAQSGAAAAQRHAPEAAVPRAIDAAAEEAARAGDSAWAVEALSAPVRERPLRDLCGNPYHPITIDPTWRTPEVAALAGRIYEGGQPLEVHEVLERLPKRRGVIIAVGKERCCGARKQVFRADTVHALVPEE